jgi:transposase-like protein
MNHYSEEFREQILKRMLAPENATVPQLHRDTGINKNTLYTWRSKWKQEGLLVDQKPKEMKRNKLNPNEKFRIVVETAHLNEAELSAYCREKGLYADQVKQWKQACLQGVEHPHKQQTSTQKTAEINKENKRLQRELKRKEKALMRVGVPVGQGITSHPYRVLRL